LGIRYTGINRLLKYLPPINMNCKHCGIEFHINLANFRYSRKKFNVW